MAEEICPNSLHVLYHVTDFDCVTLEINSTVALEIIVGYWVSNENEICPTKKAGFDKIVISLMGP
jgi:hypothetical protein